MARKDQPQDAPIVDRRNEAAQKNAEDEAILAAENEAQAAEVEARASALAQIPNVDRRAEAEARVAREDAILRAEAEARDAIAFENALAAQVPADALDD